MLRAGPALFTRGLAGPVGKPQTTGDLAPGLSQGPIGSLQTYDTGRTPEREAELQKLAEEHNGFLFGELVRAPLRASAAARDNAARAPPSNPPSIPIVRSLCPRGRRA